VTTKTVTTRDLSSVLAAPADATRMAACLLDLRKHVITGRQGRFSAAARRVRRRPWVVQRGAGSAAFAEFTGRTLEVTGSFQ
jgi:hypothetical protein